MKEWRRGLGIKNNENTLTTIDVAILASPSKFYGEGAQTDTETFNNRHSITHSITHSLIDFYIPKSRKKASLFGSL